MQIFQSARNLLHLATDVLKTGGPGFLQFAITNKCNAQCDFCGFAANKELSEKRAQAVKSYLIEQHNFPLRQFVESYGFGSLQAVADNSTRDGREQNRRVEVKLLVNRGINTNVEVKPSNPDSNDR